MPEPHFTLQTQKLIVDISIRSPKWDNIHYDINKYCQELFALAFSIIFRHYLINDYIEISLLLTNNQELHFLNNKYRKKNSPTNVLSFPFYTKDVVLNIMRSKSNIFLGDIAVSFERIFDENIKHERNFMKYFSRILVHGLLHLLGYTHESDNTAKTMQNLESRIIDAIDFNKHK